jgi:hypothetical protein
MFIIFEIDLPTPEKAKDSKGLTRWTKKMTHAYKIDFLSLSEEEQLTRLTEMQDKLFETKGDPTSGEIIGALRRGGQQMSNVVCLYPYH